MAETIQIQLADDAWTLVASSGSGFITNESIYDLVIKQAASLPDPDDVVGHTLAGEIGVNISYTNTPGMLVYARSISGAGKISVTAD